MVLNLEGCSSLTDAIIPMIAEKAKALQSLTLKYITNMRDIGAQTKPLFHPERKGPLDFSPLYIEFPALRYLDISESGLRTLFIEAPHLEVFKAQTAKNLRVLDIRRQGLPPASSPLRDVDLRGVQRLPVAAFVALFQNHPNMTDVQGDPDAQYQVAERYAKGQGVKRSQDKAFEWYRKAAQNGHAVGGRILKLIQDQKESNGITLSSKQLTTEEMKFVGAILQERQNLTSLNLDNNHIGAAGAQHLASLTGLTSLNVGWNSIGEAGAQHLASLTGLTSLNLESNHIGPEGAQHLASLTGLTSLNVRSNSIGAAGARHLASLTGLTSLDVGYNSIGNAGKQAFQQMRRKNPKLTIDGL